MEAWERFLKTVERDLGKETVERWLHPLKVVDYDACNLYLEADNTLQLTWFEEHVRERVQKELINNNHRKVRVHITLGSIVPVQKMTKKPSFSTPTSHHFVMDVLDPQATFSQFIPGASNTMAFQFLERLAKGEEQSGMFNPVYIHGTSGTGKTHLLMAIAATFRSRGIPTVYVRSETFTEHVVNAIRNGMMDDFRKAYRLAEVLLIDDVHLFARKSATQEELFHTFNTLHTAGKQIILSGNKSPKFLEEIEARLISRFEWGIILSLEKLSEQEMAEMIAKRCVSLDFSLDSQTIDFLISHFQSEIKSLHRALEALILRSHLSNIKLIDQEMARTLLFDLIQVEKHKELTHEKIITKTAEYFSIRPGDILGKSQSHDCTIPRQIAMYLCRAKLRLPFMKIGDIFQRDHSTVITSVKKIEKKLSDKEIRSALTAILRDDS